jgi:hemerythrin-like domain-containing protein
MMRPDLGSEVTMSDPIAIWHTEHANFATLLKLLEGQLDLFHEGESPDYDLMLDIMFYMTHYSDVMHHPREDLALARIMEHDPKAAPIVDDLAGQHGRLKECGKALVQALEDIVNGSIFSREHVETPGRAYVTEFRGHMQTEESTILPLAAKVLRARDWAAIDAVIRHIDDPLFGKKGEERYAALRRQIAREARGSVEITRE